MKVDVYLYATLSRHLPENATGRCVTLKLGDGSSVRDLLDRLEIPAQQVKLIFINGVHAQMETRLSEGDRVGIFPPVGGG